MTDLGQKVRKYLAERAQMRQMDFDHIHGLNVGDEREVVLKATDLTAILDEYDRRGAALVEARRLLHRWRDGRLAVGDLDRTDAVISQEAGK